VPITGRITDRMIEAHYRYRSPEYDDESYDDEDDEPRYEGPEYDDESPIREGPHTGETDLW
jgi:hypothetical protein